MRYRDIAVIGMSGRFASAETRQEFRKILKNKETAIGNPPEKRLALAEQEQSGDYRKCGYLKDISSFDHEFFGISKKEAKLMSPEQRISLELAVNAVLDAGYSLKEFKGANCGVYIADGESEYHNFIEGQSSGSVLGSQGFMVSGRIAYHLGLQGENLTIHSSCSSVLSAVHYACEKITFGEIDSAIVGGVTLSIKVPKAKESQYDSVGIISDDDTIRAFGSKANGTVYGEGGGFLLLKDMKKAEEDGDNIYGVLLSGAAVGDGARCTSALMPSLEAEEEALLRAWDGIDASDITEIEAHGVGSPLGDAMEIQGLAEVIKRKDIENNKVLISTVKPNIGHLMSLAGIASFIKVLMGYEYQESYPIASLDKVNPKISMEHTGLKFTQDVHYWEPDAERMTGISGFGLNGCNVHLIVKNYVLQRKEKSVPSLLKISAKTKTAFDKYRKNILEYLENENISLGDFIYTLDIGRDDYPFRQLIPVHSLAGMKNNLQNAKPVEVVSREYEVIFYMKNDRKSKIDHSRYEKVFPGLSGSMMKESGVGDADFKVIMYQYLLEVGLQNTVVFADDEFKAIMNSGNDSHEMKRSTKKRDDASCCASIKKRSKTDKEILVVDFSAAHAMSVLKEEKQITVYDALQPEDMERFMIHLYCLGNPIHWKNYFKGSGYVRVPAPVYPYDSHKHWFVAKEKKIFVLKGEERNNIDISQYPYNEPYFRRVYEAVTGNIDTDYKLAMYRYLLKIGINPDIVLADKRGTAIVNYCKGRIGVKKFRKETAYELDHNYDKAIHALQNLSKEYKLSVFDFGQNYRLREQKWGEKVNIISLNAAGQLQAYLENPQKVKIASVPVLETNESKKVLPVIKKEDKPPTALQQEDKKGITQKKKEVEEYLERVWIEAFNLEGKIGHNEDFFELGGNSLIMQSMSDKINVHFHKKFNIFEIYENETIEKLAARILEDE